MPVERQPAQKRRRLPFNPPRPRASASAEASKSASKSKPKTNPRTSTASASKSTAKTKTPASRRKSVSPPSRSASPESASASESGSDSASARSERSLSQEPDYILAEITTKPNDVESSDPTIPPKLLTTILHHHFQSEKTKIAKDANVVVAKYVDIFVREALARATYERQESEGHTGSGGRSVGDGFLEVEDLEKLAPQLVLDF
ncbi:hypothetical protein VTN02DRAFT_1192 [Thermoascus thermophilus]